MTARRLPWALLAVFLLGILIAWNEVSYRLYSRLESGSAGESYVAAFDRLLLGGHSRTLNRKNCETARDLLERKYHGFVYVCRQGRWF